jgi:hypothetical protein
MGGGFLMGLTQSDPRQGTQMQIQNELRVRDNEDALNEVSVCARGAFADQLGLYLMLVRFQNICYFPGVKNDYQKRWSVVLWVHFNRQSNIVSSTSISAMPQMMGLIIYSGIMIMA